MGSSLFLHESSQSLVAAISSLARSMRVDPPWLRLLRGSLSAEGSSPAASFFQLATLTSTGLPSVRTVVFRGWHHPEHAPHPAIKIVTDARSAKVDGIRKNHWAEACWYFRESRKQYRLAGRVTLVDAREQDAELRHARLEQWRSLSDAARLQFRYPPPGRTRLTEGETPSLLSPDPPSPTVPEDCFVLLLLHPSSVDVVDLLANERHAFVLEQDGSWNAAFLNP